jgi:glycine/D-amino acid oxidase-like deaminating enzyme
MAQGGDEKAAFKVVVAGGGIAGVTLANCLERAGSKFIAASCSRVLIAPGVAVSSSRDIVDRNYS